METIDWVLEDTKNSLKAYVILEAMSEKGIESFGNFDSSKIDVCMEINGIPVNFSKVLGMIEDQLEDMSKEEQKKGYDKAVEDVRNSLDNLENFGL